ncbi:nuclease-related domain-containing protein [Pseudarthrobacter siccitolerans]|uniref:nuclease-related domain-containing protein n=1 Tax=Pseudarthrobacter siccitolerans TaxID=861266 RepID=UPI001F180FC8|nr:nuclease-related domain-containing protein [Pseudarthrobacter siccitolerans]
MFSTIWYFSTTQSNPNWLIMGLTCFLIAVLTVGFWFVVAMLPKWWTTRKRPAPPTDLATAYLAEEIVSRTVHGVPGRGLSVGRFGERAEIGAEGERRTARLITGSVLPAIPSARLINGLRWPGSEHADLDHAVIAGNRIALIDSKLWADGTYWWDNKQLFRNGRELKAFGLGAGVEAIRAAYPGYVVDGWVVLHSPSGSLTLPSIERAGMFPLPGRAPVRLVTPLELVKEVHAFLVQGDAPHTVQVPALAALLRSMV